jgi:hypothetical protein
MIHRLYHVALIRISDCYDAVVYYTHEISFQIDIKILIYHYCSEFIYIFLVELSEISSSHVVYFGHFS